MSIKFHVAMFCSDAAYAERKLFYAKVFGAEPHHEGHINEGNEGCEYFGSCWDFEKGNLFTLLKNTVLEEIEEKLNHIEFTFDGYIFGLLKNPDLAGMEESLDHIGFFFDSYAEFEAAIERRGIDKKVVKSYPHGVKQVFNKNENGDKWEFTYQLPISV